jgi:hypothetical protein
MPAITRELVHLHRSLPFATLCLTWFNVRLTWFNVRLARHCTDFIHAAERPLDREALSLQGDLLLDRVSMSPWPTIFMRGGLVPFASLAKKSYPVILSAARVSVRESPRPDKLHRPMTTPTQRPAVPRAERSSLLKSSSQLS